VGQLIRAHLPAILIVQGVLAWVPFAFLKYMAQEDVNVMPFLVWHLLGVVPGAVMSGRGWITRAFIRAYTWLRDRTR
jgi:hypothetical protein